MRSKLRRGEINQILVKIFVDVLVYLGTFVLALPGFFVNLLKTTFNKILGFSKKFLTEFLTFLKSYEFKRPKNKTQAKPSVKLSSTTKRKKKKQKVRRFLPQWLTWTVFGSLITVIFLVVPVSVYVWFKTLPSPELLGESTTKCTRILDRKERFLYEICPEVRSDPVKLGDISPHLINATLSIEDSKFYKHEGFRIFSMARAAKETILHNNLQGGSTITQQLVKLSLLSPERTLTRKMKELVLSVLVERKYSKDQILELYLNNTPYGGNIVGAESASQKFFGKSAKNLTLAESALLAGLPTAPSVYSPFSSKNLAKARQKTVLNRMVELSHISEEVAAKAYEENLSLAEQKDYIRAPHFVDYVRQQMESAYGKRYVNFGGLTIVTTLDLDVQEEVQKAVVEEVVKSKRLNITNGAAVVLSAKTGEILAMVGSTDYFNLENDGVFNASTAYRQPGSSIKPVTYSLALSKGYKASTLIEDAPFSVKDGNKFYTPLNYDGKFHGKVSLRQALANSYNIPAVKVLSTLKIDEMVELGRKMGLTSWKADGTYGLAITLGGKETRLLDLTNVYGTLARNGSHTSTKPILKVFDSKGYKVFDLNSIPLEKTEVLSPGVGYLITDILSDAIARRPAFGVNNYLTVPGYKVAVKTGTTDQKRDNYTVGYTPSFVTGVWVGNNNNAPMNQNLASGLSGAAPLWNRIMTFLLKDTLPEQFDRPKDLVERVFPECGNIREIYIKGTEPAKINCVKSEEESKDKKEKEGKKKEWR